MRSVVVLWLAAALASVSCGKEATTSAERAAPPPLAAPDTPATCGLAEVPLRYPPAARIVAIGDLHGDLAATRAALQLAGAIDGEDRWIGEQLVVVQVGDMLDRGNDEPEILALLDRLPIIHLQGNHELMNAAGDLRYVTPEGFDDFGGPAARLQQFQPGGARARQLAKLNTIAIVGDTVFVHGGVLPEHVDYGLQRINDEIRCWLAGESDRMPNSVVDPYSPVWNRDYSLPPERCDLLDQVLQRLGATRMVVGHTPQFTGISSACGGKIWRIDVGLAAFYGGPVQVLEIAGEQPRVLHAR